MGWGDEIIVTGQARVLQEERPGHKVVVQDRNFQHRRHEMWLNNPRIATRSERLDRVIYLQNAPGYRPYIAKKFDTKWVWKDFDCPRGEIYFLPEEVDFAAGLSPTVIIEPSLKAKASINKYWGRARWVRLVELFVREGITPIQLGAEGTQLLPGAALIRTPSFRLACAVLARAKLAVLHEGGLHHAAAALGVRAVVIFGGFISPRQTGYSSQVSLFTGGEPCGMRIDCDHCTRAMQAITPEEVFSKAMEQLNEAR